MHDRDRAKKLLQRVRENQHRITKYLFTRITGKLSDTSTWLVNYIKGIQSCKAIITFSALIIIVGETNEILRTLVMWEKHNSEEPLNSHEIG